MGRKKEMDEEEERGERGSIQAVLVSHIIVWLKQSVNKAGMTERTDRSRQ